MKAFVCVLVACFIAVQGIPRPTFNLLGGGSPLSSVGGIVASVSAGIGPGVFASAILKGFGGSGGVVPTDFLSAFKSGLSTCNPDGSIPVDQFTKAFDLAGGNDALPTDAFGDIFKNIGGGSTGGFTDIFSKFFGSSNTIPAGFADHFDDILKAKDDVPAQEFTDAFQQALEAYGGASGNTNSKDSLSIDHKENSETSLDKDSEKSSGFNLGF